MSKYVPPARKRMLARFHFSRGNHRRVDNEAISWCHKQLRQKAPNNFR